MTKKNDVSKAAKALSALGASKGGIARRENMTPEQRSESAKKAAEERWAKAAGLPRETHSGVLKLGQGIPCSVLNNGKRVFSVNGLARAFDTGGKGRRAIDDGGLMVPPIIAAANMRPFIAPELLHKLENPIQYRSIHGGQPAMGYEADVLNLMCDALLEARAADALRATQQRAASAAEILTRAFAKVGVIALIDEATGYQADRASEELQRLVEAYVVEDMRPWVRFFPDLFFKQVYRIHGWTYRPGITQGPRYVGKFINRYVYERLPPPVLEKLRKLNPVAGTCRKYKHTQFLTEDIGEPTVDRHIASVTTLMSVANSKKHFDDMYRTAFPRPGEQMLLSGIMQSTTSGDDDTAGASVDTTMAPAPAPAQGSDVEVTDTSVRERILSALRGGNTVGSGDLAMAVYGDRKEGTFNKLRKRLHQLKAEGFVESPSKGIWKMRSGSPA